MDTKNTRPVTRAGNEQLAHWDGKDLARLRVLIADELQLAWAQGNIAREH